MKNEEWKECVLGDIIEFKNGRKRPENNGNFPVYGGNGILAYVDQYNYENCIAIGRVGAYCGSIYYEKNKCWISDNAIVATAKGQNCIVFCYYLLKTLCLNKRCIGTGQPLLTQEILNRIVVSIPSVECQNKIAKILSALDDKIEINNAINRNLEEQAQALFKNWFMDFEPFAKEPFVDAPNEQCVPKSLKMVQVNDVPHLLETGRRPKGGAVKEGIPSIGAENVKQLGVFDYSSDKFIPREFAESLGKGKINGYELLLYKDGGKPGTFIPHFSMFGEGYPYEECYINEHVFKLDFGDKGLNIFAYFYFQTDYVVNWLANNGGKAAIPGINQNDVNAIWIYDLSHPKVQEFGDIAKPMFEQILKNCKQNRQLSLLRDSLLPILLPKKD